MLSHIPGMSKAQVFPHQKHHSSTWPWPLSVETGFTVVAASRTQVQRYHGAKICRAFPCLSRSLVADTNLHVMLRQAHEKRAKGD